MRGWKRKILFIEEAVDGKKRSAAAAATVAKLARVEIVVSKEKGI